jgi:hypothetical protein
MIIDAFPFGYGADVLLIRLRELAEAVDRHVIVEADRWHSGVRREPLWPRLASLPEFAPFVDKVEWTWAETPSSITRPWGREQWLRDVVLEEALRHAGPGDQILFGDHDEIPHPVAIAQTYVQAYLPRMRLLTRYHEWYLNLRKVGSARALWEFRQPLLVCREFAQAQSGSILRAQQACAWIDSLPVGWHLTLQGGADEVFDKLQVCAHRELAVMQPAEIKARIENRLDILDRCTLEVAPGSELPATVQRDLNYWRGRGFLC